MLVLRLGNSGYGQQLLTEGYPKVGALKKHWELRIKKAPDRRASYLSAQILSLAMAASRSATHAVRPKTRNLIASKPVLGLQRTIC